MLKSWEVNDIIAGAATVSPYLVREYEKIGVTLLPGYGLTESANLVSGNPEAHNRPDSVGFVYPDMQVRIVDNELWLKGKNITPGYVSEDTENENAFEDGWFKTGDLVRFDENGLMYIIGRKKEIIVLSTGVNVSPAEIETKFNELDCVQDSLIYEENGSLVLEVVPRQVILSAINDKENFIREEINNKNQSLPSECRVSKIIIREKDFARSSSMKILRKQPINIMEEK